MGKSPEHIGLVAIGGANWMGGANYIRHLAMAIDSVSPVTKISLVCGKPLAADWRDVRRRLEVAVKPSLFCREPLRRAVKRADFDFLYPLTYDNEYNLGLRFPIGEQLAGTHWAGWVPDFQHRYLPELFSEAEIQRRDTQIAALAAEAPRVVLSSQSAAEDFAKFHPEHAAKAVVLTFATNPICSPKEDKIDAPPRFLLVCNQFWKHKNHLLVFDALRLLRARGVKPVLLCTGQLDDYRDRAYADSIRAALVAGNLTEQVTLLGLIPRIRQLGLMRRALAIVQPSLFEGWSTVVEDARALGRPCLLSDLAVHREQNPPHARFFDPHSAEALADLIAEAWEHWPAGPDFEEEPYAHARSLVRLGQVGMRFLEIARDRGQGQTLEAGERKDGSS